MRMLRKCILIAVVGILGGCGGADSPAAPTATTPPPSPPVASFQVSCDPAPLTIGNGCGSGTCSVRSINGFSGQVGLSCIGLPGGVQCDFGPGSVTVPANGLGTTGFAVSVDSTVSAAAYVLRVAGNGDLESASSVDLVVNGVNPPEIRGNAMTITGCAGYVPGIPNSNDLQSYRSVFVGAWRGRPRDELCDQTLSSGDGSFSLMLSGCFREGETVHLTSGGLDTCVSVPYQARSHARVNLFGRRGSCP